MDARVLKNRLLDFWKIELQEVGKSNPNYTNYNQTNYNQTEYSYSNPINQSKTEEKDDGEDG